MIIRTVFTVLFNIVFWILDFLGVIPSFPSGFGSTIVNYITRIFSFGAGMLFYFIRPATFFFCIDIIFFIWYAEPIYNFIMWLLRKLPFISVE